MNVIIRLHLLLLVILLTPSSYAYDSWIRPSVPTLGGGTFYTIVIDYSITGDRSPIHDTSACEQKKCVFAPMPRTGLGPNGILCDSGGVCDMNVIQDGVSISKGTTWSEAFELFIKRYGSNGLYIFRPWAYPANLHLVRWDALCVGFASIGSGEKMTRLAPGTACGSVPRADINCTVNLPSLLDLGTVSVGSRGATQAATGAVECSQTASVTGSLLNNPQIDGNDVEIDINGHSMGNIAVMVGTGTSVPLMIKATIRGTLRNAGSYSSDAILQISYY